jgi:hypothetical protein
MLGLSHRRVHDTRRTFITLARQDGAREDVLKWITHGRPQGIMNVYSEPPWEMLASEVRKLVMHRHANNVVDLNDSHSRFS